MKAKIIEVALRRFGDDGYEKASTRQIALDAGVNPPALQYYFESKEGLYVACGQHIGHLFVEAMQATYDRAKQVEPDQPGEALDVLCDMLYAVADFLFDAAEINGWSRFLARVQNKDGEGPNNRAASEHLEDELFEHATRLVGLVIGRPMSDIDTRLRTVATIGQLQTFHLGRDGALRRLGWPDLRGRRLGQLKDMLRAQTRAALGQPGERRNPETFQGSPPNQEMRRSSEGAHPGARPGREGDADAG